MLSFREFLEMLESRQFNQSRQFKKNTTPKLSHEEEYELTRGSLMLRPYKFQDYTIRMTVHATARTMQRRPDFDHNDMIELHNKVIQDLVKNFRPYGFYLYYSQKQEQGYVVKFDKNKQLKVVTVLPKKKHKTDSSTKLIMVESLTLNILEEFFECIDELSQEILESLTRSSLIRI